MQLSPQTQQILLQLQQEIQYRQRQAAEASERIQLILSSLGLQSVNVQLVPVEQPIQPSTPGDPNAAAPKAQG